MPTRNTGTDHSNPGRVQDNTQANGSAPSDQQGSTPGTVNGVRQENEQSQGSASNAQQSEPYVLAPNIQSLKTESERRALGL
ncbi:hypothetical protein PSPO01_15687 [Paraphaeosphaeria sporulosa]